MPETTIPNHAADEFRHNIECIINEIQLQLYGKINEARQYFKKYIETGDETYLEQMWICIPSPEYHKVTKEETFEWARKQFALMGPGTEYHNRLVKVRLAQAKKSELEIQVRELDKQIHELNETL